ASASGRAEREASAWSIPDLYPRLRPGDPPFSARRCIRCLRNRRRRSVMPACRRARFVEAAAARIGRGGAVVHRRVSILAARLAITGGLAAVAPVGCGVVPLDPPGLEGPGASQGTPTPRGAQAAPPAAPGGEFQPETGPYVGGSVVYNYIEGDFDGNRTLVSQGGPNQVTIAIPAVDPGFGGRLSGGWRWSQAKLELAVMQSHHDDHFNGVENSAIYTTYDMNGYYYLPTPWSHVKPNVMGGFALPSIDLNHA